MLKRFVFPVSVGANELVSHFSMGFDGDQVKLMMLGFLRTFVVK